MGETSARPGPRARVATAHSDARASGVERRRLRRSLAEAEVEFLRSGRVRLVSLSQPERKVPALREGIKTAFAFAGVSHEICPSTTACGGLVRRDGPGQPPQPRSFIPLRAASALTDRGVARPHFARTLP